MVRLHFEGANGNRSGYRDFPNVEAAKAWYNSQRFTGLFDDSDFVMEDVTTEYERDAEDPNWRETKKLIIADLRATDWAQINTVAECRDLLIKLVELL